MKLAHLNKYAFIAELLINQTKFLFYFQSLQSKHLVTKPSLGLGSNQVLFGGIMRPASAISINSYNCTGYIAKAATQSSWHLFTSSSSPLIPPTKSILSSHLKSEIPKIGDRTKSVNNCESNYFTRLLLSILSSLTFNLYH